MYTYSVLPLAPCGSRVARPVAASHEVLAQQVLEMLETDHPTPVSALHLRYVFFSFLKL